MTIGRWSEDSAVLVFHSEARRRDGEAMEMSGEVGCPEVGRRVGVFVLRVP